MSLITERNEVVDIYSEVREKKWVIPEFNAENLTTLEAILEAVFLFGKKNNIKNLPVIIGITNNYSSRSQSVYYTHTKKWNIGIKLFLKNLEILTSADSPYHNLRVMVHLDHIQWDGDSELLKWNMKQFSSIMYDASTLPLEKNIKYTAEFVDKNKNQILIEGACDEISSSSSHHLTSPDQAEEYFKETGVDIIVPNLGTEHRSSSSTLKYEGVIAREISRRIGPRLCLHGASSLAEEQMSHFYNDGICKVNIWTILERDSAPALFRMMVKNAAKIIGQEEAKKMLKEGFLGKNADINGRRSIKFFATSFRGEVIYNKMKDIVQNYLRLLYV
jgi:fructose-bisphosphate aldolase, class II